MKYYRAVQNFTGEYPEDGAPYAVTMGQTLPESDRAVQHDLKNGNVNFRLLDTSEPAPAKRPGRAVPKGSS